MMEMEEERLRMREYFMKNVSLLQPHERPHGGLSDAKFLLLKVDANKDRVVSLEEFLKSTEKRDFNSPKEWEVKEPEEAGLTLIEGT